MTRGTLAAPDAQGRWIAAQRAAWGRRIKEARLAAGLTQEQLASLMRERGADVTAAAIGLWEQGKTTPIDWMRVHVARSLGRHEAELFAYTISAEPAA